LPITAPRGATVAFQNLGRASHRYRFGNRADFEREVNPLAGVHRELKRIGFGGLEAGLFSAHAVGTETLVDEKKTATRVGPAGLRRAGTHVGQRNGGAGYHVAGRIGYGAENGPGFKLGRAEGGSIYDVS
jgi:hypothetical protein